jgi:hypothetical protein
MSRRRSTSRCARRARRCTPRWAANRSRCASSSRCAWASRRPSTPVVTRLERYPTLRFKLDPTTEWTPEIIAGLVATGAVDSVDFKGLYVGTIVDQAADPVLYRRVVEAFPDAWIEDPKLTEETDAILGPIATASPGTRPSTASPTSRPCPSRRGWSTSSRRGWGRCARCSAPTSTARPGASGCTAAGSSSSAPAAATSSTSPRSFIPDTPNDVAPGGYNAPDAPAGLPTARWPAMAHETGFRWG